MEQMTIKFDPRTATYSKEYIAERISGPGRKWALHALLALYNMQSEEEKAAGKAIGSDGRGFNRFDAKRLNEIARLYKDTGILTHDELFILRKRLPKYAGQLMKLANKEG